MVTSQKINGGSLNVTVFGKSTLQIQLRTFRWDYPGLLKCALKTSVFTEWGREMRKRPWKRGRSWRDTAIYREKPGPPEADEARKDSPLRAFRGNMALLICDFECLISRSQSELLLFWATWLVLGCYGSPRTERMALVVLALCQPLC